MTGSGDVWSSFTHDPRDPANAQLRAADRDRDIVQQVLGDAYAEGRLDREEYDDRTGRAVVARVLGDLPPLIADLVATRSPARRVGGLADASPEEIRARAVAAYHSDLREAVLGVVVPSLICVVIWFVTMRGDFFWPAFVMLGTGINLLRTLVRRPDIIERHVQRLEKQQAKELRAAERPDLDQPDLQRPEDQPG